MSEQDEIQTEDTLVAPESQVPDVSEELASIRAEEASEAPVEEGEAEAEEPKEELAQEEAPQEPEQEPEQPQETEAERAQRFYELRQQQKQVTQKEISNKINQEYKPQPVDQLTQQFLDQGYDEFQATMLARDEVRNQREALNEQRAQIAELNAQIEVEAIQVMHEFPIFDPNSKEYDADFATKAGQLYERAANVQVDPRTGAVTQTSITPYTFYKSLADLRTASTATAQAKAQKAVQAQMAAVEPPTSSKPVTKSSDEDRQATGLERAFKEVV